MNKNSSRKAEKTDKKNICCLCGKVSNTKTKYCSDCTMEMEIKKLELQLES